MKNKHLTPFVSILGFISLLFSCKDERVHIFEEYSPSGKLIKTHEYIILYGDTILQGKFVNYNENGIKIAEGKYVENEPNGICKYYYDDGKIESVFYRKNSKIDLEAFHYYQNGTINQYTLYDDVGKTAFFIKFNKKVVTKYDGYALLPLNQYKINNGDQIEFTLKDTLKVGDVIKYDYVLANIPYAKRTFKIETEGIDNSKVKRTITKEAPTRIIVEEVLTQKGLNRIKAITQYRFDDKVTPIKNDTVSFDVNVK
ncbi:toxin-antitoxin system YwqK family antitoxin [Flavobacterium psychrophilum]|uniref:toxin-antitoxin system YwqK family antitoxin n=1 Tax=Flavobacterium psychrophilum TaxID=96345 RepID=UPI000B7C0F6D|nr:hypothetical protein [Flavobacterium psychrophilum]MBF2093074.1 hypothetical protein [Flavobacterium psychrophilum]SNA82376.1 conserved hypothetical protein [Flavobacterium psychrophilum]SNA82739.1 conserved hypothetical protein [Flavobacterium psychrophilum]